jgi:hypothetical protein
MSEDIDIHNMFTADGVKIVEGLKVWDYDLRWGEISLEDSRYKKEMGFYWDGWFDVYHLDENGNRTGTKSLMNSVRVSTRRN